MKTVILVSLSSDYSEAKHVTTEDTGALCGHRVGFTLVLTFWSVTSVFKHIQNIARVLNALT